MSGAGYVSIPAPLGKYRPGFSRHSHCISCVSADDVQDKHSNDCDSNADEVHGHVGFVAVHAEDYPGEDEDDAEGFELVFHGVSFPVVGWEPKPPARVVVFRRLQSGSRTPSPPSPSSPTLRMFFRAPESRRGLL